MIVRSFTLRRLTSSDSVGYRAIRLDGLQRHPEAFGADYARERSEPDAFFAALLQNNTVLAGFDPQGEIVGVTGLRFHPGQKQRHVATIWGMYVLPEWRGSGLAKTLLMTAIAQARECISIRLAVSATNAAATALYRSAGFTTYGTDVAALYVDGVFHDTVLMRLDLTAIG
ncbi:MULTISPECIES: GNAT family N-acetyltransferase [Pantoea]|uniref:GNAT family N-acetyltransferase n=1 Tax=Pantoea TaxID=53335 RepID=UPI000794445B|nr:MULTISPECIES: GNAT family N-acetyltransferase [Pantoea]KTS27099.1 hypothetical protein NS381_15005 [Pantoea stewartii]